jgi:hypothetical protein
VADDKKPDEKISLKAIISTAASVVSIAVFLGWGDQLRQLIPFARPPTSATATPTPYRTPVAFPQLTTVPDPVTVRTTTPTTTYSPTTTTPDPETARWNYINRADTACNAAVLSTPGWVPTATYDYMMAVLRAREKMETDWQQVLIEPHDAVNVGRVQKMWSDFTNANWYWKYMADSMAAGNKAAFNANLNNYTLATSSFVDGANRYGFKVCNFQWNTMNPYR